MVRQGRSFEGSEAALLAHLHESGISATKADCASMLDPKLIVRSYESFGGTGPNAVAAASGRLWNRLDDHRENLAKDQAKVDAAYKRCLRIARTAGDTPQTSAKALSHLIETL